MFSRTLRRELIFDMLIAGIAIFVAGIVILSIAASSDEGGLAVLGAVFLVAGLMVSLLSITDPQDSSWHSNDAVVYAVSTTSTGDVLIVTDEADTLHCVHAGECTRFVLGDHIIFSQLTNGTFVPRHSMPDIKNVRKG